MSDKSDVKDSSPQKFEHLDNERIHQENLREVTLEEFFRMPLEDCFEYIKVSY